MKFLIIFIFLFLNGSEISHTKKILNHTLYNIKKMNRKMNLLASDIIKTEKNLNTLNSQIENLNKKLSVLQNSLRDSSSTLEQLNKTKEPLLKKQKEIKEEIISFVGQNYYINSKKIETLNDLIYTSLTAPILKQYSKKIEKLIKENKNIENNITSINLQIKEIIVKKENLEKLKKDLTILKKRQQKILAKLQGQKKIYKNKLENMLKKEDMLQKKLAELKIIKKRREIPIISTNIKNINVKKVGNAYIKPKTTRYRGRKTIPPVRGKVIKKFGSYIDPIYKIKIYNDTITIKTRPNALVKSILPGKVIYVGENNGKKIIFIKHRNHLFSIYANLDKISPLIKKGSYVKKGQIIARVKNLLEFEVTYKDKAINPLQVIKLR